VEPDPDHRHSAVAPHLWRDQRITVVSWAGVGREGLSIRSAAHAMACRTTPNTRPGDAKPGPAAREAWPGSASLNPTAEPSTAAPGARVPVSEPPGSLEPARFKKRRPDLLDGRRRRVDGRAQPADQLFRLRGPRDGRGCDAARHQHGDRAELRRLPRRQLRRLRHHTTS